MMLCLLVQSDSKLKKWSLVDWKIIQLCFTRIGPFWPLPQRQHPHLIQSKGKGVASIDPFFHHKLIPTPFVFKKFFYLLKKETGFIQVPQ